MFYDRALPEHLPFYLQVRIPAMYAPAMHGGAAGGMVIATLYFLQYSQPDLEAREVSILSMERWKLSPRCRLVIGYGQVITLISS